MNTVAATSAIQSKPTALKTILLAWLTAGCLDLLGAITVYSLIMQRVTTMRLLQGIARGALGNSAYEGGILTAWQEWLYLRSHFVLPFFTFSFFLTSLF